MKCLIVVTITYILLAPSMVLAAWPNQRSAVSPPRPSAPNPYTYSQNLSYRNQEKDNLRK